MTNDEEVKEPVASETPVVSETDEDEVLTADDLTDEEKQEAEKETQAQESSGEKKPAVEETSEEKPEEVVEGDKSEPVVTEEKKTEPKPVEGETPRERALRLEVERVKRANRQLKGDKLLKDVKPVVTPVTLTEEDQKALESYDPEQLANLRKVTGIIAKQEGWVKKDEFSNEQRQQELKDSFDDWMDQNPEFSEDQDPDGVMWKALQHAYKERNEYRPPPKNSKELNRVLNGIKKDLFGVTVTTDTTDLRKVEAQKEKIKVSSHGAGSSAATKPKSKTVDPEIDTLIKSGAMKGFDDKDLEEYGLK
jgi:hypothetical protein